MPEQESQGIVNRLGLNQMIVVEDKDHRAREGAPLVDQGSQDDLSWRRLWGLERAQGCLSDVNLGGLHR
jgi:hypothetical protein